MEGMFSSLIVHRGMGAGWMDAGSEAWALKNTVTKQRLVDIWRHESLALEHPVQLEPQRALKYIHEL